MKKKMLGLLFASLTIIALSACSDKEVTNEPADVPKTEETAEETPKEETSEKVKPTGKVVEATINAKSFDFDLKEIKANVGDTVKLTLVNVDGAHGVGIDQFKVDVKGGNTVEFVVDKAGEFQYYCNLMCGVGHDKMIGNLIVQ
jgi:heme/copper-type cytochrome/quinol oxidase subunit 2